MSVNKVILIGNVGKDPEIRYFENDRAVANFTLATTERGFTTSSGQQIPDRTEWHNIVVWGGLSKVVENYVKKGSPLYIEGKIRTRSWDDKDGNKRYTTEIYVDSLELLGRKGDNSGGSANYPGATANRAEQPVSKPANTSSNFSSGNQTDDDLLGDASEQDDLPF